jgi:hypothetical protein
VTGAVICFVLASLGIDRPPSPSSDWSPARRLGYAAGLKACVQSLRRRHRRLPPVLLLRAGPGVTLADVDEVIPIETTPYTGIPASDYFGPEVFYKLEVFNLRGYDRVVYLDCDTLVLDDVSPLWDMTRYADRSLYAVRETADMGAHPAAVGKLNTGVMVVNRPWLTGRAYRCMLDLARAGQSYDGGDQGVVNQYLEQEPGAAGELEPEYNVMVLVRHLGQWDRVKDRIKILHYVNSLKPWAPDHHRDWLFDPELKRLWDDAYGLGPVPFEHDDDRRQADDRGH